MRGVAYSEIRIKRDFTLVLAGLCYPNGKLFLLSLTLSNFPFALMRSI
jgi:hypothetical protein